MRKKQLFRQIEMSWQYQRAVQMVDCSPQEYQEKYKYQLQVYPDWFKNRMEYLFDKLSFDLRFDKQYEFDYGVWGRVKLTINGGFGRYWRQCEPKISVNLYFKDLGYTPKAVKDFVIPDNANLCKPEQWIKNLLKTMIIEEGYFAELQLRRNLLVNEIHKWALPLMNYKHPVSFDADKSIKKIEKRYNVKSYVSIESTVNIVNKIGKQTELVKIAAYDFSWTKDFDGDVDDLEEEFYNTQEKNTIYV